jgi:hypothetical protein
MARPRATSNAAPDSSKVAGRRSTTSEKAGSPCRTDCPKSPRSAPPRKRPYWTRKGSLKPMASRKRWTSSALASGGSRRRAGSPVRWRIKKTTKETPSRTRSDWSSRRRR